MKDTLTYTIATLSCKQNELKIPLHWTQIILQSFLFLSAPCLISHPKFTATNLRSWKGVCATCQTTSPTIFTATSAGRYLRRTNFCSPSFSVPTFCCKYFKHGGGSRLLLSASFFFFFFWRQQTFGRAQSGFGLESVNNLA